MSVTMKVDTPDGVYSVRDCGSDRKPWVVERVGFHYPIAAFHEQHEAEAYLTRSLEQKSRQQAMRGRRVPVRRPADC